MQRMGSIVERNCGIFRITLKLTSQGFYIHQGLATSVVPVVSHDSAGY